MLPMLELEGPEQMALDSWMLEQCVQGKLTGPLLRFYTWPGPWLSLGHHQRELPEHWVSLDKAGHLQRVRRPSGGGAVLHAGGLTYALIWPNAPRMRKEAYQATSQWLMDGLNRLGVPLQPGHASAEAGSRDCFASATRADLIDAQGHKRIGSAQFWRRGHLLQHGEIVLSPPAPLWSELFGSDPPPTPQGLTGADIIAALTHALQELWPGLDWQGFELNEAQWQAVNDRSGDYRLPSVRSSSSNPEVCIEATACTNGSPKG